MKTITFIANLAPYGGVETVFKEYAHFLLPHYHLTLVSLSYLPDNFQQFCQQNGITYLHRMKKPSKWHLLQYIKYKISKKHLPEQISKVCQKSDYIIDFKNGEGNQILKNITNRKFHAFMWIHGGLPFVKEALSKKDFSIYDKIVCLTDSLKNDLSRLMPKYQNKFIRIYNPLNLQEIQNKATQTVPDLPQGKYFLHVSRIDVDKDFKTLLDGYELFYHQTQSQTPLYLIGDGSTKSNWETYAASLSSAAQIHFIGKKANPFPYMKSAQAVVLSSPSEGLPCVLIEALCCTQGIVVSSDCPNGPREILGNGKYGLLFDVGDAKRLADILQQIDTAAVTHELFTKGLEAHLNQFSLQSADIALNNLLSNS